MSFIRNNKSGALINRRSKDEKTRLTDHREQKKLKEKLTALEMENKMLKVENDIKLNCFSETQELQIQTIQTLHDENKKMKKEMLELKKLVKNLSKRMKPKKDKIELLEE